MKKHIKTEHEVVKYLVDLNFSLSLMTPEEHEELIQMVKPRLDKLNETKKLDSSENLFTKLRKKEMIETAVAPIRKPTDVSEIQNLLMAELSYDDISDAEPKQDSRENDTDEERLLTSDMDEEYQTIVDDDDDAIIEDTVRVKKSADDQIKVILKREIKNEVLVTPSPAPTPNPSSENLYELSMKTEETEESVEEQDVNPLEESMDGDEFLVTNCCSFCRRCYTSFKTQRDQFLNEQKAHSNPEDLKALNRNISTLKLEDFAQSCDFCDAKFFTNNCLGIHRKEKHGLGPELMVTCKVCNIEIRSQVMKRHMNTHQKGQTQCKLCYKEFTTPYGLKCHENQMHKDDKKFFEYKITEEMLQFFCDMKVKLRVKLRVQEQV